MVAEPASPVLTLLVFPSKPRQLFPLGFLYPKNGGMCFAQTEK